MIRLGLAYLGLAVLIVIGVAGLPGASLLSGRESASVALPETVATPAVSLAQLPPVLSVQDEAQASAPQIATPQTATPLLVPAPYSRHGAGVAHPAFVEATEPYPIQDLSALALRNLRAARALTATTGPDALARIVRQSNPKRSEDPYVQSLIREASLFPAPFPSSPPFERSVTRTGEEFGEGDLSEPVVAYALPRSGDLVHVVGPGDSLGSLALRYYGDAAHYLTLFTANRALLATPDGLRVGQSIIIPDLSQP